MKCLSQYIWMMSLKMRWVRIWATFGIQTMPMMFPAGSKTNCLGMKCSIVISSRSSRQKNRHITTMIMTIACKSANELLDKIHAWILQTFQGRSWPHGWETDPDNSLQFCSFALINVRSVWGFLMSIRVETLHDYHIPCAFHSQAGHGFHHTSHNTVHSGYFPHEYNIGLQQTAYVFQGHCRSLSSGSVHQWHCWQVHQSSLSVLLSQAWTCTTYT